MLKEIHHRVKNNLQVISSLLKLQSSHVQDKSALDMFNESRGRIQAMALVHEKLYQSANLSRIDFGKYVASLTRLLHGSYGPRLDAVAITSGIRDVFFGIDIAVPLGMIINELVSNSLKYAFPPGRRGNIRLELSRASQNQRLLRITDDGVGFPKHVDFRKTETLGMQLVCALTEQIGGSIEMVTGNGTEFRVAFRE
jgi:two-component sensor histidine kinase